MFPTIRMRRARRTPGLRLLAQETTLARENLIYPVFVVSGADRAETIALMPGVERISVDLLTRRAQSIKSPALLIFGVPDESEKDEKGVAAARADGLIPSAVAAVKAARPDLTVITDVCLCGYTVHGHCGALTKSGEVDNDATLSLIAKMSEAHAAAGADMVAPSGMMDGQIRAIREGLDKGGFRDTAIMSYAAKFASSFYGPFREAAHSAPAFGDRRSYQLPPGNRREAVRDALLDVAEGADWLMVKPAMPYLDVLSDLRRETRLPLAAYQVSGEYSMIRMAAASGALDERSAAIESLLCIRRAGADAVITYFAEQAAEWLM